MDINFDQFSLARHLDTLENSGGNGELERNRPLDWNALAARMAAAQDARQVLTEKAILASTHETAPQSAPRAGPWARRSGSFAPALAPRVSAYLARAIRQPEGFTNFDVNQDAKAAGNPLGAIGNDSKGNSKALTAVRGPK